MKSEGNQKIITEKVIKLIGPLKQDRWLSIHRYQHDLKIELQKQSKNMQIKSIDTIKTNALIPPFINRRFLYPFEVSKVEADIYHIVDQSYGNLIHFLPSQRCVLTCHDLEFWRQKNVFNYPMRLHILNGLKKAKKIVCVSHSVKDELVKLDPRLENKINVIYNNLSSAFRTVPVRHDHNFKYEMGLSDKTILLNVGSCNLPRKNIEFIFEIVKKLSDKIPICFVQVGGPFTAPQKKKIKRLKISNYLRQHGNITDSELLQWYRCSDFYLMPSLYEGFGLPLIEAAACGLPVLFSDIPVFKELSKGQLHPLLLDPEAWIERIIFLTKNTEQKKDLINTQFQWVKNFDSPSWAQDYMKVYETFL